MGAVVNEEVLAAQQFAGARGNTVPAEDHRDDDEEPRFREKEAHRSRFDR